MTTRSKTHTVSDPYCQICSSSSSVTGNKRLSSFACDHCHLSLCHDCFTKHSAELGDEHSQLQTRFSQLTKLFDNKRQFLSSFEDHCLRSVNSAFDEVLSDLENLRKESTTYVKNQFNDADIIVSDMITNVKSLTSKSQQNSTHGDTTKNNTVEFENQRKQISDIEHRLNIFSSPTMAFKLSTLPRNKLELHCQLLSDSHAATKKFSTNSTGKLITTNCSCGQRNDLAIAKVNVDTDVEELHEYPPATKITQTDPIVEVHQKKVNDEEYFSFQETSELSHRTHTDDILSTRYRSRGTILTQNEVDRIASDGNNLLYFSDLAKSLCYITNILSEKQVNGTTFSQEITCRWPYSPLLDLVYSPVTSQFICATKTGIYTCSIDPNSYDPTMNIQMQLVQLWSYVRLSIDQNFLWVWADTARSSELRVYSPKTFDCIRKFDLKDYPRFSDNSTTFCSHTNTLATVFQFKQTPETTYRKYFSVTLSDNTDLHELCTIRLGECDIDHEIRANNDGEFFITNGKHKLWIVDRYGKKEYVQLHRIGRAIAIHSKNQIFLANGTHQLQCIELIGNHY